MTGFGVARGRVGRSHVTVELRSVNHRFCEVNARLPGRFANIESDIIRRIRENFSRGKFEVFIREESSDGVEEEFELARKAYRVLNRLKKELDLHGPISLSDLVAYREILYRRSPQDSFEVARDPILRMLEQAVKGLRKMRESE